MRIFYLCCNTYVLFYVPRITFTEYVHSQSDGDWLLTSFTSLSRQFWHTLNPLLLHENFQTTIEGRGIPDVKLSRLPVLTLTWIKVLRNFSHQTKSWSSGLYRELLLKTIQVSGTEFSKGTTTRILVLRNKCQSNIGLSLSGMDKVTFKETSVGWRKSSGFSCTILENVSQNQVWLTFGRS